MASDVPKALGLFWESFIGTGPTAIVIRDLGPSHRADFGKIALRKPWIPASVRNPLSIIGVLTFNKKFNGEHVLLIQWITDENVINFNSRLGLLILSRLTVLRKFFGTVLRESVPLILNYWLHTTLNKSRDEFGRTVLDSFWSNRRLNWIKNWIEINFSSTKSLIYHKKLNIPQVRKETTRFFSCKVVFLGYIFWRDGGRTGHRWSRVT